MVIQRFISSTHSNIFSRIGFLEALWKSLDDTCSNAKHAMKNLSYVSLKPCAT